MSFDANNGANQLTGHALRNAHLRERSLERARAAPPLAQTIVKIRAETLGMTRLEFSRRSGISRGTLRDLELGIHIPTRRVLQKFVEFCQSCQVGQEQLENLRQLYAGQVDTLERFLARLELRAGSPKALACLVGISSSTLWEYRRGNFPLPLALLRKLCQSVGEDEAAAESLWFATERKRLRERGYPEALAEFWVLCARQGFAETHLARLGITTATVRRLRYLEVPAWLEVAKAAQRLCRGADEMKFLKSIWQRDEEAQVARRDAFGLGVERLRKKLGITRRQLADLFGIGGKKPARILKYIEEDGFYSAQAYPAGLAALLTDDEKEQEKLLDAWRERRRTFHRRHRPEMRIDLRLMREIFGFDPIEMEPILGYSSLEYQKIERGVCPLLDTAQARILEAIHQAGRERVRALLEHRGACADLEHAWRAPCTVCEMVSLLARREGGLIPLMRFLVQAGLKGLWTGRLRAIAHGEEVPPWHVLEGIGKVCAVDDLTQVHLDWDETFRAELKKDCDSPLGIELRTLIAEVAPTLRAFSPRLGFNYSVLVRDLQRIDRDQPIRWFHVERILQAASLPKDDDRWKEIHALWYTTGERASKPPNASRNSFNNSTHRGQSRR